MKLFLIYGSVLLCPLYNRSSAVRSYTLTFITLFCFQSPAKNIRLRTCHSVSDNVDTETACSCLIRNLIFYLFVFFLFRRTILLNIIFLHLHYSSCARFSLICCASARISSAFSCTVAYLIFTNTVFCREYSRSAVCIYFFASLLEGLYTRSPKYDLLQAHRFFQVESLNILCLLIICVYSLYKFTIKKQRRTPTPKTYVVSQPHHFLFYKTLFIFIVTTFI